MNGYNSAPNRPVLAPSGMYEIADVPFGHVIELMTGDRAEVRDKFWGDYGGKNHRKVTNVRVRVNREIALIPGDTRVMYVSPPQVTRTVLSPGTVVEVIGGKHRGTVGLVAKATHTGGRVPIVSPKRDDIVRVDWDFVARVDDEVIFKNQ